jgi:murein DD-endopeptidase MepM/ murein hydrolase activator NlpD
VRRRTLTAALLALALASAAGAWPAEPAAASGGSVDHAKPQRDDWLDPPAVMDIAALFERPASEWGAGHRGIDVWLGEGEDVFSPDDGVVTFAGRVAGRGIVVVLHPSGLRSTLEPVIARVGAGAAVSRGEPVGTLELAGSHCAPRACLHWGVRRGDAYLDPLDVLRGSGPIRLLPLRDDGPGR